MITDFEIDVNGKKIHFERNIKLKPCDCILPWTKEHIEEFIRCKNSYQYFIEKYCRVLTETGMQIIKLRDYQEKILHDFHNLRYNCLLAPRQCVDGSTMIKIKNKKTGDILKISIENAYDLLNKK